MTPENSNSSAAEVPPEPAQPIGLDHRLMTTRELMSFLNLSRTKIWELVKKGDLPAFKLGGDYRYRQSEVVAWLENFRVKNDSNGQASEKK
jgi:excisionase family DNA binding protein